MAEISEDQDQLELLKERIRDFKHVFGGEAGERVLVEIEKFCHLQTDGFSSDPHTMAYIAGRRSVGLFILEQLELSRSDFQEIARLRDKTAQMEE